MAQILVVPRDSVTLADAQDEVIAAMRSMRGLGPRDENNFALLASQQIYELFNRLTAVFDTTARMSDKALKFTNPEGDPT